MTIYCLCFYGRHGDRFAVHRIGLPGDEDAVGERVVSTQCDGAKRESTSHECIPRRQLPANEA